MPQIVFIHGMFQNPKSWEGWLRYFGAKGYDCVAPAWPLHEGEPAQLRSHPPDGLGKLRLKHVIAQMEGLVGDGLPIVIGHSVGGLVAQVLMNRGRASAAVAISSVAPNKMLDMDFNFFKNAAIIANPLKGDEPVYMDAETFHGAFANTLTAAQAAMEFERTATHDSRNVFRDCMGPDGHVDLERAHGPLLLIGGEKDEICPADLCQKNAEAYEEPASFKAFAGRSHYICNEPGWEDVAGFAAGWLAQQGAQPLSGNDTAMNATGTRP